MKNIKAVILAGGLGTRLRPITCTRPKPMCMLLDETVIERIILKLSECGIQKAAISTMYLSDKLCNQLGKCVRGVDLLYVNEETPKGSAGGAKLCATELGIGNDDIFVILSGDGVFDFSLTEAIKSHVKRGAEVTIVTSPTKNPLEYGVILSKEDGRIYSFTEKPGWSAVKSDSVNTGIKLERCLLISRKIQNNIRHDQFLPDMLRLSRSRL
jgi:mannose-1-phosphate guanylyltransferase/phosphomannomutase